MAELEKIIGYLSLRSTRIEGPVMARKRTVLNVFSLFLILTLLLVLAGCGGGVDSSTPGTGGDTTSVTLAWDAPTTNIDGSPLTDLAGYKLYYGTSPQPEIYATPVNLGRATTYTTPGLSPATYYFVVTAYDTSGNESTPSNEIWTTVQ